MGEASKWRVAGTYLSRVIAKRFALADGSLERRAADRAFAFVSFSCRGVFLKVTQTTLIFPGAASPWEGFYDSDETGSPWTVSLYVDRSASDAALDALSAIFLGKRGGNILSRRISST
jgi:hypothetical protein